jgi:hypothetical protein
MERIADAFGLVLALTVTTFVVASLVADHGWGGVAVAVSACLSACVALGSAGARHTLVREAIGLSAVAVALSAVAAILDAPALHGISSLIQVLLLVAAAGAVLRAVVAQPQVGFRTILGAISVYIAIGLIFTFLFVAVDRLQAGSFFDDAGRPASGDFLFFSFTTLTTTGYGDLVPAGQPGRMLAVLEMLTGQIFLVTLIAGLVSVWRPGRRSGPDQ